MTDNPVQVGWNVATASVRGASHLRTGTPNQDACGYWLAEESRESAILAVSDGHGSLKHFRSQTGAQLAVSTAVAHFQALITPADEAADRLAVALADEEDLARRLVEDWRSACSRHLQDHPFSAEELQAVENGEGSATRLEVERQPILAYGATLLVVVSVGGSMVWLQLGDGDILIVQEGRLTARPFPQDERLVGNRTTSLCQPEAWKELRVRSLRFGEGRPPPALVLLSTDGYANSFRTDDDFLLIGRDYLDMIHEMGLETVRGQLPEILKEASEQGSGDDITLGLLARSLQGSARAELPRVPASTPSFVEETLEAPNDASIPGRSGAPGWRRVCARSILPALALTFVVTVAYLGWGALGDSAGTSAGPPVGAAGAPRPNQAAWVLAFDSEELLWLKPGATITAGDLKLAPAGENAEASAPVAEVLDSGGETRLKNVSQTAWKVTVPSSKDRMVEPGNAIALKEGDRIDLGPVHVTVRRLSNWSRGTGAQ